VRSVDMLQQAHRNLVGVGEGRLLSCIVRQHREGRLKQQARYVCNLGFALDDGPAGGDGAGSSAPDADACLQASLQSDL
jgi:hypothetical protein